jgi:hypothetical protein
MTAIGDFCNTIRAWLGLGEDVYPDEVVTSWVRMSESLLSGVLRVKEMVQIDTGVIVDERYLLPSDWREMSFVRKIGGKSLRYVPKDNFYDPDMSEDQDNCYTLSGNYIMVGPNTAEGTTIEITYYQDIPPLGTNPNWLITRHPTLFTLQTLSIASMYSIEDERGASWAQQAIQLIGAANTEHQVTKASGSLLTRRHMGRGFG